MKHKYLWIILLVILVIVGAIFIGRYSDRNRNVNQFNKMRLKLDSFSISISPSTVSVKSGAQQQFLVSEINVQNPNGKWSASQGTIDDNGLYTSPAVTSDTQVNISFVSDSGTTALALLTVLSPVDGPATLPTSGMESSMAATPAPGSIAQVPVTGLQAAVNNAKCGDVLMLQPGLNYSGNFTLPAKSCDNNHWIIIRSATADSNLPPEGNRINPCYAGVASLPGRPAYTCHMPGVMSKITALKGGSPITLASGASHYRIGPGLEITRPVGTGIAYGMIAKGDTPADHIVIDRDWIHGTAQDETVRGVYLSGIVGAAVIDSYINDFHCTASIGVCVDSQGIAGGIGTQLQNTWKIENNFIEAAAENILFGGGGGITIPTDITIRHNHLFKPLTWMPGNPNFVGAPASPGQCTSFKDPGFCPFIVKNLFELKNAHRLLFEGNILENVWAGFTQYATVMPFQALNQTGSNNPNTTVSDITIRYNKGSHAANAFSANIVCLSCTVNPAYTGRISWHDDVFDDLNAAVYGGGELSVNTTKPMQFAQCPTCTVMSNLSVNHITLLMSVPKVFMIIGDTVTAPITGFSVMNSIIASAPGNAITANGNASPCAFVGPTPLVKLNNCTPGYSFAGNVLIGATSTWPPNNYFPVNGNAVGFNNYNNGNGGDYTLSSTSPYKGKATDGKDPGADIALVNQYTQGVN